MRFRPRKGSKEMRIVTLRCAAACLLVALTAPAVLAVDSVTDDEELVKQAGVDTDGPTLLEFFKKRTVDAGDGGRTTKQIADLGREELATRESASAHLAALGPRARQFLKEA